MFRLRRNMFFKNIYFICNIKVNNSFTTFKLIKKYEHLKNFRNNKLWTYRYTKFFKLINWEKNNNKNWWLENLFFRWLYKVFSTKNIKIIIKVNFYFHYLK